MKRDKRTSVKETQKSYRVRTKSHLIGKLYLATRGKTKTHKVDG